MRDGGVVTRRGLLITATALALSSCAPLASPHGGEARRSAAQPSPAQQTTPPPPAPAPDAASETSAPAVAPQPDVEAVIAAHEGRVASQWGLAIPGVIGTGYDAGSASPSAVHLTLDACGGPAGSGYDAPLIEGLVAAGVPATLFLNQRWILANQSLAHDLAQHPLFSLQNHGTRHLPLSVTGASAYGIPGTASVREAANEVWDNQITLTELSGRTPQWFRPGTAYLDDVGLSIAAALGVRIAGFAINGDGGATLPAAAVAAEVTRCTGGEFVIAHMNQPGSGTAAGILQAIPQLLDRGVTFAALD